MKMNVEIDLDWLKEDEGIEEEIRNRLIESVVAQCLNKLAVEIEEQSASKLDSAIDLHIASVLADLMNRQIKIADKYGSIQRTYENIDEMLDEKFESFLTQRVDKNGEPFTSCSYGEKYTRIDHLIDSKISERAKTTAKKIINDTEMKIANFFKAELQKEIAEKLFRQLDLESLLKKEV